MKNVLTLTINIQDDGKTVNAELKHRCKTTSDALNLIRDFLELKDKKNAKKDA